jgi:hypothetical protein
VALPPKRRPPGAQRDAATSSALHFCILSQRKPKDQEFSGLIRVRGQQKCGFRDQQQCSFRGQQQYSFRGHLKGGFRDQLRLRQLSGRRPLPCRCGAGVISPKASKQVRKRTPPEYLARLSSWITDIKNQEARSQQKRGARVVEWCSFAPRRSVGTKWLVRERPSPGGPGRLPEESLRVSGGGPPPYFFLRNGQKSCW